MITLFFSTDPKITGILVNNLDLKKIEIEEGSVGFDIYKKAGHILCHSDKGENIFRQAFLYAYSEFDPEVVMYVSTAKKISTEIKPGDIILPNVFFELNKDIWNMDLSKENRDGFLKDPIFLEQYTLQNDYDFNEFGLRVGGICVTGEENTKLDDEVLEKIQLAYEADVTDDYSYWFADEAKKLDILERTYVVLGALSDDVNLSLEHIVHIINFLLDNLDGKNPENMDTDEEKEEDLLDDEE